MIKAVFFDLDGTLLPMDNEEFTKGYFKLLVKKLMPLGYDGARLVDSIWAGTAAMVKNDGSRSNYDAFWERFAQLEGEGVYDDMAVFDEFYANEFNQAQALCGRSENLISLVAELKERGIRVILATNPVFPATATENRIRWAGFVPEDFELYTTYENIGYCKPNTEYYRELLRRTGLRGEECIMVGNDADEDTPAEETGMKVFLLTDHLINKHGRDISGWENGDADRLRDFLEAELAAQ